MRILDKVKKLVEAARDTVPQQFQQMGMNEIAKNSHNHQPCIVVYVAIAHRDIKKRLKVIRGKYSARPKEVKKKKEYRENINLNENMKKKKKARFWGRIFSDEKYIFLTYNVIIDR